eukprot:947656-Prymnesium_polylepis.1
MHTLGRPDGRRHQQLSLLAGSAPRREAVRDRQRRPVEAQARRYAVRAVVEAASVGQRDADSAAHVRVELRRAQQRAPSP